MTRLDHNRALSQLAEKTGAHTTDIRKLTIWGNHSSTQYPDLSHTTVGGKAAKSLVDQKWIEETFIPVVQQRGAAIIKARGASSAASAAAAAIDHVHTWVKGTPDGDWVSMAVPSDGSYGIKEGVIYSYPVTTKNGEYSIVQGLSVDDFSRKRMDCQRSRTARRARWREGSDLVHDQQRGPHDTLLASLIVISGLALGACQPRPRHFHAAGGLSIPKLAPQHARWATACVCMRCPIPNTASVSVAVWYDVGSKNDPPGRSGFAHLFEHLMFKATANMPPETFDRLTEDVGGFNNASTADDFTNYYETVPANHLQRVLWAEAERMGSLVVDEETFNSERAVVQEEFRQSILSQPYGKLFGLYMAQANFDVHPYGRPGIGSIADLDAATLDDVKAFHAAYYRPDNAMLVVAGNFDPQQLDAWVDQYFGPLSLAQARPSRGSLPWSRRARRRSRFTVYAPNVPLPAVAISWPAPAASSPDIAAWMVLDAILQRGQSSRLYQSLVYEQQLAAQAGSHVRDAPAARRCMRWSPSSRRASPPMKDCKSLQAEVAKLRDNPSAPPSSKKRAMS